MSISKGILFVGFEELERLFGLPEGVEILSVEKGQDGFDFKLASSEDVNVGDVKVTYKQKRDNNTYRRLGLRKLHGALNQEIAKGISAIDIDRIIKEALKEHREDKKSGYTTIEPDKFTGGGDGLMFFNKDKIPSNGIFFSDTGKGIDMNNSDVIGVGGFSEGKAFLKLDPHERVLSKEETDSLLLSVDKMIESLSNGDIKIPKLNIPNGEKNPINIEFNIQPKDLKEEAKDIFAQVLKGLEKKGK